MQLFLLPGRPDNWDARIAGYVGKTFFHESAWLDYVETAFPHVVIRYYEMRDGGVTAGYLCVMHAKKFVFEVWGSPLASIGMYSGPLMRPGVDQRSFMRAVVDYCEQHRIAGFELCNPALDRKVMESLRFQPTVGESFETSLEGGTDGVWDRMRGICRTRIRKAEKNGLVAETVSDPEIVPVFHRQFEMALASKGLSLEYGIDRPRALYDHLHKADRLISVWVKSQGEVIASAFYPHDGQTMYFWDAGYNPQFTHLSPNELLHWTAIKAAVARGIQVFNIGGAPKPSLFTQKFGGRLVPHVIYERTFARTFKQARDIYRHIAKFRTSRKGWTRPAAHWFAIMEGVAEFPWSDIALSFC